jgi:hypothetical protein
VAAELTSSKRGSGTISVNLFEREEGVPTVVVLSPTWHIATEGCISTSWTSNYDKRYFDYSMAIPPFRIDMVGYHLLYSMDDGMPLLSLRVRRFRAVIRPRASEA